MARSPLQKAADLVRRNGQHRPDDMAKPKPSGELGVRMSTVTPERVEWLWQGRIPKGKLTVIDGDPGLGKSLLTMDIAARVSAGLSMPGVERQPGDDPEPSGVVLLNAEDGLSDTIQPRLAAAGANLDLVLALQTIPAGHPPRPPRLPDDVSWIGEAIDQMKAGLVIIDPLMAYLDAQTNSHRDQDCRLALHPLAILADKTGAAVVIVRHLNKAGGVSPLYRGGGSIGIMGAARSGLLVARDPDDQERRVLASIKCNLAKLPTALAYTVEPALNGSIKVAWQGESQHTAGSLLAVPMDGEERNASSEAAEVLRSILSGGARTVEDVKREARKAGISDRTLYRAKAALDVRSRLIGFGKAGAWHWALPDTGEAAEVARDCQD